MKFAAIFAFALAVFVFPGTIYPTTEAMFPLAEKAVIGSETESAEAIRRLRNSGPEGLRALLRTYSAEIYEFRQNGTETDRWRKIAAAIDAVAMQKDAYASGLYWYTDLNEAKKAANVTKKPILTLRLLGNLNEEFSCANSRLFRSLLYANAEVSGYLRDNYILHWKSVRPAPRITVDFGDGRKIERTITGNSIHYILSSQGLIIDALPGLYSPKLFLAYLTEADRLGKTLNGQDPVQRDLVLMRHRSAAFSGLSVSRGLAVQKANVTLTDSETKETAARMEAFRAGLTATTKMVVTDERSMLRVFDSFYKFEPNIDFGEWQKLADAYSPLPELDAASTAIVRRQTAGTGLTPAEFDSMFARLRSFVGLDTTRNEFLFHTRLYEWLNADPAADLEALNSRVYAELFKTPDSDKWLGLYSTDVYTALDGNGITK